MKSMETNEFKNNDRVILELSVFDVKMIIPALKEEYRKAASWDVTNPGGYPPQYWYVPESKKAKQLLSTIKYIERQLEQQGVKFY